MTWYLIVLIVDRDQIIAALAAMLKVRSQLKSDQKNFWQTVVVYALLLGLGIIIIWTGLPQRILASLQGMALNAASGPGSTPGFFSQFGPNAGPLPTSVMYYGVIVAAAIVVVSFSLILGGVRLAYQTRVLSSNDLQTEVKEQAVELVQKTITRLNSTKEYHEIILQCYKKMCEILSNAGLEAASQETAREFAVSISSKLRIGNQAVTGLTFLFEEARYSKHEISEQKRIMALSQLQFLQQALSANVGVDK
jgi:hypothetical protein